MKVNLNFESIEKAALAAFEQANQEAKEKFQASVPVRSGKLKNSYKLTFSTPTTAIHEWTAPYAIYVHEPVTKKDGSASSGNDWTAEGLQEYSANFNNKLSAKL